MPSVFSEIRRDELICEYRRLQDLDGFNPQTRGQRFNGFISETFANYGIRARPNNFGPGEIDVAFEMEEARFVLEAKWEKDPLNEDPITKLRDRVKKRLAGTIGIVLSISGFTKPALEAMKIGQRLEVVLLTREHFEAVLFGFLSPHELLSAVLDNAHFHGRPLTPLAELRSKTHRPFQIDWNVKPVGPELTGLHEETGHSLIPLFRTNHCSHVQEVNERTFLVAQEDGIIKIVNDGSQPVVDLGVPYIDNFVKTENGYLVIRGNCLGEFRNDIWKFLRINHDKREQRSKLMSSDWRFTNGLPGTHSGSAATPAFATKLANSQVINLVPNCRDASIICDRIACLRNERGEPTIYFFDFNGTELNSYQVPLPSNPMICFVDNDRVAIVGDMSMSFVDINSGEVTEIISSDARQLYHLPIVSSIGIVNIGVYSHEDVTRISFYRLS